MNAYEPHIQVPLEGYKTLQSNGQDASIVIVAYGSPHPSITLLCFCLTLSSRPRPHLSVAISTATRSRRCPPPSEI